MVNFRKLGVALSVAIGAAGLSSSIMGCGGNNLVQ